ncbi:sulfurtransferase [Aquifex aeolicus]|uniref:Sulfurtransferase n=1 Tax=Aquifex aeolicus (strain VF5) TaxID=224324 RepID=O67668_AQUAE|nr:sulfurtransferase [Aquifex aeolicus]AAC07633.1 thiosulfate sulfurtransferase [Aquifex aeolicus VF5]
MRGVILFLLFFTLSFAKIYLISPEELHKLIKEEKNLVIIDLRKSIKEYWKEHIPGAQWVHFEAFRFPKGGTPAFFLHTEIFVKKLEKLGIDKNTPVVLYDAEGTFIPFYVAWGLDYINHKKVYVLHGGFNHWKDKDLPTTKDYPKVKEKRYGKYTINKSIRADLDYVKKALNREDVVFLDARTPELYEGKAGFWKRLGHIKGAVNRFWKQDFEEHVNKYGKKYYLLKPKEDISLFYESLGIGKGKEVILYCGQGLMSAATYYVIKYYLGLTDKVRLYDGSWNEYSQTNLPKEP